MATVAASHGSGHGRGHHHHHLHHHSHAESIVGIPQGTGYHRGC